MTNEEKAFERRKDERPEEIVEAAFVEFAERGYAETRLQDVAKRAGVSKGLPYLYFKTKEQLFKQVLIHFVKPRIQTMLATLEDPELTVEAFLKERFLPFAKQLVRSRKARILRLLIAEGPKHPDLTEFYAKQVIKPALDQLGDFLNRREAAGEIKSHGLAAYPQLIMAPVMMSAMWLQLFQEHVALDVDAFLEQHVSNLLTLMQVESP